MSSAPHGQCAFSTSPPGAGACAAAAEPPPFACAQGDGVPPSEARAFCDWLGSPAAPTLHNSDRDLDPLPFTVLAAGDKSYINFCACGKALDARLQGLGGRRWADSHCSNPPQEQDSRSSEWKILEGWSRCTNAA